MMRFVRLSRNALAAAAMISVLLISVLALWFVARDAPSSAVGEIGAVPRAAVSPSDGCQNFATYWLSETSVDIEPPVIEGFTNCRIAEDGRWYVWTELPSGQSGSELTIPEEARAASEETRAQILEDIEALQARISPELQTELDKVRSERTHAVIGQIKEGVSLSSVRTRYARIINGFTLDPDRTALAEYVGWVMESRINAYGVFRRACLHDDTEYLRQPCVGMEDNLSIRYAPWYWELPNP